MTRPADIHDSVSELTLRNNEWLLSGYPGP